MKNTQDLIREARKAAAYMPDFDGKAAYAKLLWELSDSLEELLECVVSLDDGAGGFNSELDE